MNPLLGANEIEDRTVFHTAMPLRLKVVGGASRRSSAARFWRFAITAEVVFDLLTIVSTLMTSRLAYDWFALGKHIRYPGKPFLVTGLGFAGLMVLMLYRSGTYRRGKSLLRVRETEQVLRVSAEALVVAITASFFSSFLFSRWLLTLCFVMVPLVLLIQKSLMDVLFGALQARGYGVERVLIYGAGATGQRVFSVLTRSPKFGFDPVLFVDDDPNKNGMMLSARTNGHRRQASVLAGPLSKELLTEFGIDAVIVALPSVARERLQEVAEKANSAHVQVFFVPNHLLLADPLVEYRDLGGILLASFGWPDRWIGHEALKRLFDVVVATALLVCASPLLFIFAMIVRMDSKGAAFFCQERVGRDGELFRMFKLRTMYQDANKFDFSPTKATDPRITRIGRFLRRTSLDELPQLLNVIFGNMSLVGPRPEMPFIVSQYDEWQRQRLQVKPGLTGLWQLSGDRAFLIHENIDYDLYYIQNRNFFMDLAILLHTPIFAMRGI